MLLPLLRSPCHKGVYVSCTVVLEKKLLRLLIVFIVMILVMLVVAAGRGARRDIRERIVDCLLEWLRLLWLRGLLLVLRLGLIGTMGVLGLSMDVLKLMLELIAE